MAFIWTGCCPYARPRQAARFPAPAKAIFTPRVTPEPTAPLRLCGFLPRLRAARAGDKHRARSSGQRRVFFVSNLLLSPNPRFDVPPSLDLIPPMPRKVSEIVEEARQMPYGERAELIEQLIADTAKDLDPKIEKAWGDEALRRIAEIESGKAKGIPLDEALARVRKTVGL